MIVKNQQSRGIKSTPNLTKIYDLRRVGQKSMFNWGKMNTFKIDQKRIYEF